MLETKKFSPPKQRAFDARFEAQKIAFGPVVADAQLAAAGLRLLTVRDGIGHCRSLLRFACAR